MGEKRAFMYRKNKVPDQVEIIDMPVEQRFPLPGVQK